MKTDSASTGGAMRPPKSLSRRLLSSAASLTLLYALAHLAGWREHTSFLSGTVGDPNASWERAALEGTVYLVLHFGFVVAVPILIISSAFAWLANRIQLQ